MGFAPFDNIILHGHLGALVDSGRTSFDTESFSDIFLSGSRNDSQEERGSDDWGKISKYNRSRQVSEHGVVVDDERSIEFLPMRSALTEVYSYEHVLISMCPQRIFVRRDFALKKGLKKSINRPASPSFEGVLPFGESRVILDILSEVLPSRMENQLQVFGAFVADLFSYLSFTCGLVDLVMPEFFRAVFYPEIYSPRHLPLAWDA
ncbi:hypothetical protein Taro_005586 [Colocasia esculenta]|uniref:Uncharacterized protein n=1 Tax=Colocasia esculenta TaxID=4460 RepID=A0A843TNJ6_COLES|nr:hypothetical protein [Colocasia esculenta]